MHRTLVFLLALAGGCGTSTAGGVGAGGQSPIVGNWLSADADVAPLLAGAPFNYTRITADFKPDSTYEVTGLDKSGKSTLFTGTYQDAPSAADGILTITVTQVQPTSTTAEGIYRIDGATMQYEVVQTQPTNGLAPPTATAGFGSTIYNGKKIATLVQKFAKQ